jgi:hypothetical protein
MKSRKGRRKFSAGKLISPEQSLDENIDFAAVGQWAVNDKARRVFQLVALWEKFHTPIAGESAERFRARASTHESRMIELLQGSLRKITANVRRELFGALDRLDPKLFRGIAEAIDAVNEINASGAFQQVKVRAGLLVQELFRGSLRLVSNARRGVTLNEFHQLYEERFHCSVDTDVLRRECKGIGIRFTADKVGRKKSNIRNSDNCFEPTS